MLRSLKWSPPIRFVDELRTHYLPVVVIALDLIQVNIQTAQVKPLTTSQNLRQCLIQNGTVFKGTAKTQLVPVSVFISCSETVAFRMQFGRQVPTHRSKVVQRRQFA